MTKTICDICGNEMPTDTYPRTIAEHNFCISSYGKVWDVCNNCRNELLELLKKYKYKEESEDK